MASFDPSSVYGNRVAWQELVLVTSQDGKNIFHRTPLWRQGLISEILMLPRGEMVKPPQAEGAKYGAEGRFTKVQEMKQAVLFSKHYPSKPCSMGSPSHFKLIITEFTKEELSSPSFRNSQLPP